MNLKNYALSKSGYSLLRNKCLQYAISYKLNFDDLLSIIHERLTVAINRDPVINDDAHAKATVITIVRNAALDSLNRSAHRNEQPEENETFTAIVSSTCDNNYEVKDFFRFIDSGIRKRFKNKPVVLLIYENCILGGLTYDKFSEQNNVLPCTVRTQARSIKKFANQLRETI